MWILEGVLETYVLQLAYRLRGVLVLSVPKPPVCSLCTKYRPGRPQQLGLVGKLGDS